MGHPGQMIGWDDPDRADDAFYRLSKDLSGVPVNLRLVDGPRRPISDAERRVVQAIASGLTESEAAEALGLSPYTVSDHMKRVRRVLRAKTSTQACVIALRKGLIA